MDDKIVGILGGGQLGRMLIEAANNRNIRTAILDKPNCPAQKVNGDAIKVDGAFSDHDKVMELAQKCDIITMEIEHVDTQALEQVSKVKAGKVDIQPGWDTLRTIQDKYAQKLRLIENKISVSHSVELKHGTTEELETISEDLGLPFMLKAKKDAYDGRGNYRVSSAQDFGDALKTLHDRPLYAEQWVDFAMEIAVMVVKTREQADVSVWRDSTMSYPTVEQIVQDNICKLIYAPARGLSDETNEVAQTLARRAVASFRGRGIFGVEMFLLKDGKVIVNEIAPRPHNSGHYTIEACRQSQFDTHLSAILEAPIRPDALEIMSPCIMLNILGGPDPKSYLKLAEEAHKSGAAVHLYAKGDASPGRKMGHITYLGKSMAQAERVINPLIDLADKVRPSKNVVERDISFAQPLVSITTGSDSDQPVMEACYTILETLKIPYEKRITSAHRTPDLMFAYAKNARSRGIRVIIAAAGGAAHLPGMVASETSIPVIGVPIKPTIGNGEDSVHSILNMPRGCPVLTVGTNNSTNAALGAAKILSLGDEGIRKRLDEYVKGNHDASEAKDSKFVQENIKRLQENHKQGL